MRCICTKGILSFLGRARSLHVLRPDSAAAITGLWLKGLDQDAVPNVIAALIAEPNDDNADFKPPALSKSVHSRAQSAPPVSLFV